MKNIIKVAMLAMVLFCGTEAFAQYEMTDGKPTSHVTIDYRRPGMIGIELGYTLSPMDRIPADATQPSGFSGFNGGLAFDIPISNHMDLAFRTPYYTFNGYNLNETRWVKTTDGTTVNIQSESATVHTLTLVALGLNVYPLRKCFYMGGYFSIGFNFMSRTGYSLEDQQGTEYDIEINSFNAHIDMGLETGFDIADKFIVYARLGLGLLALNDEEDCNIYNVPEIYPLYFQFGLRIPFFNARL